MWSHKKLEGLRAALKGEPWTLVAGIPREQLATEGGAEDILEILDQKFEIDRQQQKMKCLDDFFREKGERIKYFVSCFDLMFRKCMTVGIGDDRYP